MLSDERFEAIWAPYRHELQRDIVGIWMIAARVRDQFPGIDDDHLRGAVVEVIERAIRTGEAEAAFGPYGGDLESWIESEEIAARVDREWRALGRDPNPGEIVWLQKIGGWPKRSPERVGRDRAMIARVRARLQGRKHECDASPPGPLLHREHALLVGAVERHCPELAPLAAELIAGKRRLSRDEGIALRDAVHRELIDSGFDRDWGITDYGWELEHLIDKLGHVTAVFD